MFNKFSSKIFFFVSGLNPILGADIGLLYGLFVLKDFFLLTEKDFLPEVLIEVVSIFFKLDEIVSVFFYLFP